MGASQAHQYKVDVKYSLVVKNDTWFAMTSLEHTKLLDIVV
jgi:hypothetical protein